MAERLLVATDLDRTLLPNGSPPESPVARHHFAGLAARPEVVLAYVSGRDLSLVERAIEEYALPLPDYIIGDVGTSLYQRQHDQWHPMGEWSAAIGADWRGHTPTTLQPLLADLDDLTLQGIDRQGAYKLSYTHPLEVDTERLDQAIAERLSGHGIAAARVWSIDEPAGEGLLDIVPAGATKLHAIEFLRHHLQLDYRQVHFSGDSGNDLPVLASAIPATLVGNASEALKAEARRLADQSGNAARLYIAGSGVLGMNGNYSGGIIEGLLHYLPECRRWFEQEESP